MNDKVTVLECGGEDTQFILKNLDITNKHVTVSMMLSLSFFWKDKTMLNQLQNTLINIAKITNNDVKFLYYTIEGDRTYKLFEEKGYDITLGPCHMIYQEPKIFINIENTIVVDQIEYLVKLLDLTCIKERSEHPSVIEEYLSIEEKIYGNLFVYGFGIIDKNHHIEPLKISSPPRQMIPEKLTNTREIVTIINDNTQLVRISTLQDNGSFFHAFLNNVSKEYQNSVDKNKLVIEFRQTLADYLSLPNNKYIYINQVNEELGYNTLTKFPFLPFNSYFSTSEYLTDIDYYDLKNLLLGDQDMNISNIGFLSEIFKISIILYTKSGIIKKFTNTHSNKYINIYMLQPEGFESIVKLENNNNNNITHILE